MLLCMLARHAAPFVRSNVSLPSFRHLSSAADAPEIFDRHATKQPAIACVCTSRQASSTDHVHTAQHGWHACGSAKPSPTCHSARSRPQWCTPHILQSMTSPLPSPRTSGRPQLSTTWEAFSQGCQERAEAAHGPSAAGPFHIRPAACGVRGPAGGQAERCKEGVHTLPRGRWRWCALCCCF
jgi:hypothetical protein